MGEPEGLCTKCSATQYCADHDTARLERQIDRLLVDCQKLQEAKDALSARVKDRERQIDVLRDMHKADAQALADAAARVTALEQQVETLTGDPESMAFRYIAAFNRAKEAEARAAQLEQERDEARADAESWQANYDSCNRERRQLHDLVHELRMATTKDEAWAILTRPNVLPMQQAAEAGEQTRQAISAYVQHKPECEIATVRRWNDAFQADGSPVDCTCGLSTLLLGGGTAREERKHEEDHARVDEPTQLEKQRATASTD